MRLNVLDYPDVETAHHLRDWRRPSGVTVLLCGQVPGDASLYGLDLVRWAQETTDALKARGFAVVFRPHPLVARATAGATVPRGADLSRAATLDLALRDVSFCVTFNSNAGVEAALWGVPTVTLDAGAIAWPVTGHELGVPPMPERSAWCHDVSWRQWTIDEISKGVAWEALSTVLPALTVGCRADRPVGRRVSAGLSREPRDA